MSKGMEYYLDAIIQDSYVDVYTATNTAMMEYPFIVGHVNESSPTLSNQADRYILDSTIGDETVGNEEVVEKGKKIEADWLVAADVMHEPDQTTESVLELVRLVAQTDGYDPQILLPLQSDDNMDRVNHYTQIVTKAADVGFDLTEHPIAVGGIRDCHPSEQVEICQFVRQNLGYEKYIHALGCGITTNWVRAIHQDNNLIDSLDTSSIAQNVVNGKLLTPDLEYQSYNMPRGKNSTVLVTLARVWQLYLFNYLIGPHIRDEDIPVMISQSNAVAD